MENTLNKLKSYLNKMAIFNRAIELLYWDMRTKMPKEGFEGHSEALTYFSGEKFDMSKSEELKGYIMELSDSNRLEQNIRDSFESDAEKADLEKQMHLWSFVIKKMKKEIEEFERVPSDFYREYIRIQAASENAWEEAKNASDWSIFAPHLQKMVEMQKQMVAYTHPDEDTYDAMLSMYEEGMNVETYDRIFGELKTGLIEMVQEIIAKGQPDSSKFKAYYDPAAQVKVQELLLNYIGFNFDRGTVGETEHPFTMSFSNKDVRVTNHYHDDDAISAIFSAIHEGGHAIFDQNTDDEFKDTLAASSSNMGIHESQSRFYENILGRNINFWKPIYKDVQKLLPALESISLEEFAAEVKHVQKSLIRTEADEVTYGLHIILRYEIEKAIFRGNASIDELPELWNSKMQEYLGITPSNDAEGILQDIHWSDGSFGYFPSYLLGSIYDGMLKDALQEDLGEKIDDILARGEIKRITEWLNKKVHIYGNTRTPKEFLANVCHKEVTSEPLLRHFRENYL